MHQAGLKRPNAWGLHDMHGNMWEWCQDWWEEYTADAATDPQGAVYGTDRMLRGGSWFNASSRARSALRAKSTLRNRSAIYGFRVVRP